MPHNIQSPIPLFTSRKGWISPQKRFHELLHDLQSQGSPHLQMRGRKCDTFMWKCKPTCFSRLWLTADLTLSDTFSIQFFHCLLSPGLFPEASFHCSRNVSSDWSRSWSSLYTKFRILFALFLLNRELKNLSNVSFLGFIFLGHHEMVIVVSLAYEAFFPVKRYSNFVLVVDI